jgi:hypothetical protein
MNHNFLYLYQNLTAFGTVYPLSFRLKDPYNFVEWTETNFDYVRYNPRKNIERYGLSITSLDGGLSGVPDLDSIPQYNRENNTNYHETDFSTFTPVYEYEGLKKLIQPIEQYVIRSHVLKISPGGYFPPHRDTTGNIFNTFRLLVPLDNMNPPNFNFVVDGVLQNWEPGTVYFVDTAKMHYLFNCNAIPSYMVVINTLLNESTVDYVTNNLREK